MKASLLLVLLVVAFAGDLASGKEKEHGSEHHSESGEHNAAHDQEALLGGQAAANEFAKLSPEEAKKQLTDIVKRIDTNKDTYVSKDELIQWILRSFLVLDVEVAQTSMKDYDANKDGKLTWAEYVKKMKSDENDTESNSFKELLEQDKLKFDAADVNKDGSMSVKEYAAFMHPYDFEHMHDIEIDMTLQAIDKNKDGKLSLKEFVGEGTDEEANKDQFDRFDTDKDGLLNRKEMTPWIVPSNDLEAGREADHLIKQTDMDDDNKMSLKEILEKTKIWGGSSATAYKGPGQHDEL